MENIKNKISQIPEYPTCVLQFGEGNFLRAFADEMMDAANQKGVTRMGVAVVKPRAGSVEKFRLQKGRYTVLLRGLEEGKTVVRSRIVSCLNQVLSPSEDWEELISLAKLSTLRFVISNTTEAGIALDPEDDPRQMPQSFPGKVCRILWERYLAFRGDNGKGLIFLPTELIEENGAALQRCVLALAEKHGFPEEFLLWIQNANYFASTLVDRIVTGFPHGEEEALFESLGYEDALLTVAEPFGLWVIEGPDWLAREFPLDRAGLNVVFTEDLTPWRERKVRVLNGAHTAFSLISYLMGLNTVKEGMAHPLAGQLVRRAVEEEIAPCVPLPKEETLAFARSVYERFENPFLEHALLSISLNSVSKWKARILPSLKDYRQKFGVLPPLLTFSMAALLAFYGSGILAEGVSPLLSCGRDHPVQDDERVKDAFRGFDASPEAVRLLLSRRDFWGEDLNEIPEFTQTVARLTLAIAEQPEKALREALQ